MKNELESSRIPIFRQYWPIGLYIVLMMSICVILLCEARRPYWISPQWIRSMRATLFPIAIGISVGQLSLATLWGACSGRTWLQGILFVTFLAIMQNVLIGYRLDTNSDAFFNVATYTPALFLISCLPLLILRQLKGWTLSFDKSPYIPKSQFGVEDILVICVVVAATMVFFSFGRELTVNTIQSRWANSISNLLSVGALSAIANLLILPFTFFAFRIRTCFLRLPLYCIAGAIAWIAAIGYFAILDPRIIRSPEFWSLLTGTLTATVVVYAGLKVIRFSGMQLTRYPTLVEMKSGVEVPRLSPRESSQIRNRSRGLAVGIIVCVMISNLAFARSLNTRIDQDKKLHSMILELEQQGGSCKEVGNQVTGLRLGKQATDSTVNEFRSYSKLQSLSLADSQVTDVCLKTLDQFPMLLALDLSGTNVTATGLIEIPPTIKDLSLARTQLSPSELRAFLESRDFTSLDLSGLRLSDADLISMVDTGAINGNGTLQTLSLADNPITDVAVNRLMSGNVIYSLDFSGTNIDGSGIPIGSKTVWLTLDRTNVNDSTIAPFVASMKLSIKGTKSVSIATFKSGLNGGLKLDACGITENDLANSGALSFGTLSLAGKAYTGRCFANANISVQGLDMSHSGLTDDDVHHLVNLPNLRYLNISHTDISDASLPFIAKMFKHGLHLHHTRVTAQGLRSANFASTVDLVLARSQFTHDEIQLLRETLRFRFE